MVVLRSALWFAAAMVALSVSAMDLPDSGQLEQVRQRISSLEGRLMALEAETRNRQNERERLDSELELAHARVRETELVLERSRAEADRVLAVIEDLAAELERQRELLEGHVRIMALLGRPGTLQLLFDGARGGDLEGAVRTVTALTSGQLRLVDEYEDLYRRRSERLAELSRILSQAQIEAGMLEVRRSELETTRRAVEEQLSRLEQSQQSASSELDELRERERALERLLATLRDRKRFTGSEDIREYRGALPWPVDGRVVQEFGRHYLPKYATYTVCNGLRFDVASGAEVTAVFPGEVAYARFFKGYGNMVVIDHGNEVYSLAAGLATIHVRVNQRVDMGLRLGLASPPTDSGNTYFEIRVGKKPQNPRRWLRLTE
jgi:septal ring factor EnvC (AmiA/AmiB activator)